MDIVHVDDWPDEASFAVPSPAVRRRWADDLLSRTRERIRLEHPALEVVTHRIDGQRAAEVLSTAATDADMLVLGARGLRSLTGFLVGQVGSATARTAEMPVVLVRPTAPTTSAGDSPGHVESVVLGVDLRSDCASLFAFEEVDRRASH
ncbi:universal stress protein [Streptomyces sp. NPDC059161]|uniref:universal stress protein n=1 Tax=unclassified Streptomyces TaxID=2593676 RepID=UPI00364C3B6B